MSIPKEKIPNGEKVWLNAPWRITVASSGKLARDFAEALGVPAATGTTVMKALREAGMVTMRGRGTSAANMTRRDAAILLVATASGAVSSRLSEVTDFLLKMPVVLRPPRAAGFESLRASVISTFAALPEKHTFADALMALLESSWGEDVRDEEGNERGPVLDPLRSPQSLAITIGMNGMKDGGFAIVQAQVTPKQVMQTYYSSWKLKRDPGPALAGDVLHLFDSGSDFLSTAHLSGTVIAAAIKTLTEPVKTTRSRSPRVSRAGRR
jgi:hypothetical protein